jgi:SNF2 family DNA or RNA helicase
MLIPTKGQRLAVEFASRSRYSIIALPPGQGKTLCGVTLALEKKLDTLVVCPGYARNEWINCFKGQDPNIIIDNFTSHKDIYRKWDEGVAIISYELLYNYREKGKEDERSQWLFEWADLVIVDEAHLLKETDNKRTKYAHKLIYENRTKYLMLLSGTPAKNRVYELYSLLALCNYKDDKSEFLEKYPTWTAFANYFSHPHFKKIYTKRGSFTQVVFEGFRNEKDLKPYLDQCYFRLPKDLYFKLPPKIDRFIVAEKLRKYDKLVDEFMSFIKHNRGTTPDIKTKAAEELAPFTAKIAKELYETHGPIVVFSDHIKPTEIIAKKLGVSPINSKVNMKKRNAILKEFQDGKSRYIVATIGTLSTAISLVTSRCMIINDPPWVPGDLEQTERRIRRKGQTETCFYYKVLATPQSEKIYKVLEDKKQTLNKIDELVDKESNDS